MRDSLSSGLPSGLVLCLTKAGLHLALKLPFVASSSSFLACVLCWKERRVEGAGWIFDFRRVLSFPSAALCLWSANPAHFAGEAVEWKPGEREMKSLNGIHLETLPVLFLHLSLVTANYLHFLTQSHINAPWEKGLALGMACEGWNAAPEALRALLRDVCLCGVSYPTPV